MTYGNLPEYRLAEKMKSRFSGRGAAVSGMQASTTSELVKRAQMGGDPSVNCSELNFRSGANRPPQRTAQNSGYRPGYANIPTYANDPAAAYAGQNSRNTRPQNAARTPTGGAARAENGAPSRSAQSSARPLKQEKQEQKQVRNAVKNTPKKARKTRPKRTPKVRTRPVCEPGEIAEVRVEGRRMTPMFAVFLVIGTMMIMSIVLSFSEIYQTTSEIAQLENTLADLKDQAEELELELEEKNDIRIIEQIATEELGMVKEDVVQRKYISLSDGERIDIIEDENGEEESAASGILLSSIWSSLGNLFDYFR